MPNELNSLVARLEEVNALNAAIAIMEWDQQTYMPRGGAGARAEHIGLLARLRHEKFVADETRKLLEQAEKGLNGSVSDAALLRVVRRDFDLATKLPADLVAEKAKLAAIGHESWIEARANSDFAQFVPVLEKMFELARREAEAFGYKEHIYDALLDQYEEGSTAAECVAMFAGLKDSSVRLVREITDRGKSVDDGWLHGEWDVDTQRAFTEKLVGAIGFDMERGRQDTAPHPFCTGWSVGDIRLTTRFKPYLGSAIFGSMHEAGHGMYEQGTPKDWDRSPLAGGVSLGLHESQSRLWENIIGRSRAFWQRFYPELQQAFPQIKDKDLERWYRSINKVQPSYIRVEADEVTYNLHVMVRFEVECDVLTGKLAVKDIPDAWNAKYTEYLGITPRNDAEGCLQDVHWSMGSIGYFPTYTMGNLLSYQIWRALQRDVPDTEGLISQGEFEPILKWLQDKIYSKGRSVKPKELVRQVTGKAISAEDYTSGLEAKYRQIYEL